MVPYDFSPVLICISNLSLFVPSVSARILLCFQEIISNKSHDLHSSPWHTFLFSSPFYKGCTLFCDGHWRFSFTLSSKFHPHAPVLFQLLTSFVPTDNLSITLLLTFTPYFDFPLMVQYALDALVLEDVTFDLLFLSKCSLNSLLYFIVNPSNNLFTMRIGNSSPPFSTHTLQPSLFPPTLCGNCSCQFHPQTLFLAILVCSLWQVYHLLLSYLPFSLYKMTCSLLMILSSY